MAVMFTWISGLAFYAIIERKSKFVKFYALQGILFSVLMTLSLLFAELVSYALVNINAMLIVNLIHWFFYLGLAAIYVTLLVNAFSGKVWVMPLFGKWCRRKAKLE